MRKNRLEIVTLVLALIAGFAMSGSFSVLFNSLVPFSIFPLLSLVLALYCLHQRYLHCEMVVGIPLLSASFFLLGVLLYNALIRVEYPGIGSNFLPVLLCVALIFWIGFRIKVLRQKNQHPK